MMRMPGFLVGEPHPEQLRRLFRSSRALLATYLLEPDDAHPPNAWLYLCRDPGYSLEKLAPPVRRNVRRGMRELRIEAVAADTVLAHGFQPFSDTCGRIGLSDGTPENFRGWFAFRARCRGHIFLGAWRDRDLVAFLSITAVDDWAEIEGCFSANAALELRPNDTLIVSALQEYLVERQCRLVSYGLSSVQSESNAAGLHRFKTKVGFEALPIHRAFVAHPLVRPWINSFTHGCVRRLLAMRPSNRILKKCDGVLAAVRSQRTMVEP